MPAALERRRSVLWSWLLWATLYAVSTVVLLPERLALRVAHIVVVYLLIIIGGSLGGGRPLGFTLVGAAYFIIAYDFIPPYHDIGLEKDNDWLILLGLAAVGLTTTELFVRFRQQARLAEARADEIESLSAERERLRQEAARAETLQEAERLKNALLASASHDLRTPLQTILTLAEQAAAAGDAAAGQIGKEARRLQEYVGTLLDWSRTRDGTVALRPEFNLAEDLLGAAARACRGLADGTQLRVRVEGDASELLAGEFDFALTLRAVVNLVENALKYAGGTPVELVALREGDQMVVEVRDRGPGLTPEDAAHVFDPFYRGTTAGRQAGSGLGLAIAREFARAQRGDLTWWPRPGGGSIFRLTVPLAVLASPPDAGTMPGYT